jgi:cell division protease FtsH
MDAQGEGQHGALTAKRKRTVGGRGRRSFASMISQLRHWMNRSRWRWPLLLALVLAAAVLVSSRLQRKPAPKPPITSYSQLGPRILAGKVSAIAWDPNTMTVRVTERAKKIAPYSIGVPSIAGGTDNQGLQAILDDATQQRVAVTSLPTGVGSGSTGLLDTLVRELPLLLLLGVGAFLLRNFGPFKKLKIKPAASTVSFADVAGCGEAVEELQDVREFLADPRRYEALGAKVPKGVLLYGPPGTGKTLLAKAVASEAGAPFFSMSGAEFVEMYAGLGAKRVRQLFAEAKKAAPCIIFIDELDSVGSRRSGGGGDSATREGDQTLNQLLTEMDGFEVAEHAVIVMGATNQLEALDTAILRPGRFDRHIAIDPPDRHGRLEILKVHAAGKPLADDVNLEEMAVQSSGFSGAELALWLNEAALRAARHGKTRIDAADVDAAYFRLLAGPEKHYRAMAEHERRRVAYHEAGHALIGELLNTTERVHKISIIPRGRSGGQTISVSEEDVFLHSEPALRRQLTMLLAGRAAEQLVFGELTSGAHDDLKRSTMLVKKMTDEFGMSKTLGLRVTSDGGQLSPGLQAQVDEEIKSVLDEQYATAYELLEANRDALEKVAEELLAEETLDRDQFVMLLAEIGTVTLAR